MASRKSLDSIREIIEKGEVSAISGGDERRRQLEKVEEVVSKLRKKEEAPLAPEARAARIRAGVAGEDFTAFDFSKVELHKERDVRLRAVGQLYSFLRLPVSFAATVFSRLPMARELSSNLAASGIDLLPEAYLIVSTTASTVLGLAAFFLVSWLGIAVSTDFGLFSTAFLSVAVSLLVFLLSGTGLLFYPLLRATGRAREIDRELPFALRHLATQVRAGVPLQKAVASVSAGGYGALSRELRKFLLSLESGSSTEDALLLLHDRTKSRGLRQAALQMSRSLRTGGALAGVISSIADDVSFESQMRVRDFTEQLNLVSVVFIMVAVVAPVVLTILSAVTQLPLIAGAFSETLIVAAFAAVIVFMSALLLFIKSIEPAA